MMAEYKDVAPLRKQIADVKTAVNSPNSDYMTGYICALSVTEGIIAGQPTADVVPKSEVEWLYKQVDYLSQEVMYNDDIAKMKVDEAKEKFAREIFEEIEKRSSMWGGERHINYKVFAELKKKYMEETKNDTEK